MVVMAVRDAREDVDNEVERDVELVERDVERGIVELNAADERDSVASGRDIVVATLKAPVMVGGRRVSCGVCVGITSEL
jgi:hypothetical protein